MKDLPDPLPNDPGLLKQLVAELLEELSRRDRRQQQLEHRLAVLLRQLYGRRAEKLDPNQLALELGELGLAVAPQAPEPEDPEPPSSPSPRRRHRGRNRLPDHLPRQRVEQEPSAEDLECSGCGGCKTRISEQVSEQLEYEPSSFRIIEHVRGTYACSQCEEGVVTAPVAVKPIAKGLAGPGLLAHVVTSKYADHQPLHRLEGMFARHGVDLSRSTLCSWLAAVAELATPVYDAMRRDLLASSVLHTDDTPVKKRDAGADGPRSGRFWVYVGDAEHPQIVYDYTPDRSRDGPHSFLQGFSGYLQADAYAGYDALFAHRDISEVACWAHTRRKFFDARETDPARGLTALAYIRQLYEIERRAADDPLAERRRVRQQEAVPVLDKFALWLEETRHQVLPKSPMGEAIQYARNQWQALRRYTEHGALSIDNNRAEQALRRIAVGRKNWLFVGSDDGGRRAALFYTLVGTCKRHGLDPFAYLRDLFRRLPTHPAENMAELTPYAWARACQDSLQSAA